MRLDKLTVKSQEALQAAQELAHQHTHQEVDGEHLSLSLARQQDGIIPTLLHRVGVRPDEAVGSKARLVTHPQG